VTSRGYVFESQGHSLSLTDIVKANVLIDETKHACLADFGLLTIMSDAANAASSTPFTEAGTFRWMSPELFDPGKFHLKDGRPTKQSDCYALGMLIFEVLSGQVPFSRHRGYTVISRILKGKRPERPLGGRGMLFTNEIWGILERCWNPTPCDRPRIGDVLECLGNASGSWVPSQAIASLPKTDPFADYPDSITEESTDESEMSSPPHGVLSHPSRKHPKGDSNENHI